MNDRSIKLSSLLVNHQNIPMPQPIPPRSNSHISLPPISSFDNLINVTSTASGTPGTISLPSFSDSLSSSPSTTSFIQSRHDSNVSSLADHGNYTNSIPSLSTLLNSTAPSRVTSPEVSGGENTSDAIVVPKRSRKSSKSKVSKRKECPICHNYYANLNTHKSTHLNPENRPHKCSKCNRGFSRSNDLIRHKKRHWKDKFVSSEGIVNQPTDSESFIKRQISLKNEQLVSLYQIEGAYKCPFNSTLIKLDTDIHPERTSQTVPNEAYNCHQTGVFSRCDTYKNHLKALHFEYPPKTKKEDRAVVPGKCKHCGKAFKNVDVWLNEHVNKECGYSYR
ncbi:similar to Saccharomyces cerevisiae YDL048C STP4 Protein containing a Kruppel-type zinc-finger domain [Maudiozyma saulgeensis]|uniref:pH-response transcription factor pacC/RIM101 n=1 Tax=Maudiozyma saulgeensis TaxID=1789683 RepID=A0A1X7QZ29_9SACH|nr:similar to Saccharomyces cerevisiae YDL048C STP4 Protein containing a Kruppel-type zinc-finger domain [Kazachstania saulgeensis]